MFCYIFGFFIYLYVHRPESLNEMSAYTNVISKHTIDGEKSS